MKEIKNASLFMLLSGVTAVPLVLDLPSKALLAICGTILFLILPGYGIVSTFYARKLSFLEKGLASLCLSIVLIPFAAFTLKRFSGDIIRIDFIALYFALLSIIFLNPIRLRQLRTPINDKYDENPKSLNQKLRLLHQGVPIIVYLTISYVLFFVSSRRFWDDEVGANLPAIKDVFSGDWGFIIRPFERPLVAWTLEIGHYFFGVSEFSARALFITVGGITVLSTYLLATELFDESTGWKASLILATLPCQIAWSGITRHAVIMTPFYVLSIHFFYKSVKQREPKLLYLSTICMIASQMASELALLLIPTFALYALVSKSFEWFRGRHAIISMCLFVTAYFVADSFQRAPFSILTYGPHLRMYFSEWALSLVSRIGETYFSYILNSNPLLVALSLIGLFIFIKRRAKAEVLCLIWISIYVTFLFIHLKNRSFYALPLLPALCIMAAYLMSNGVLRDQIGIKILRNDSQNHKIMLALLCLILLVNFSSVPYAFSESRAIAPELWNAAYDSELFGILGRETSPLDIVLLQPSFLYLGSATYLLYEPSFSFYSRRPVIQLDRLRPNPPNLPDFTPDFCRRAFGDRNVYYVSVNEMDDGYIRSNFPHSREVLNSKYAVLKLLNSSDNITVLKSGQGFIIQTRFLKITVRDRWMTVCIWEPWPDEVYTGKVWYELVMMKLPTNPKISIDEKLIDEMPSELLLFKNRLKLELIGLEELLRIIVYSTKPIIDLEVQSLDHDSSSQSLSFNGLFLGQAVVTLDESTIRRISQNGMFFERIERRIYSMNKSSVTALGLASKYDQNVVFMPINSDAKLDCRGHPYFNLFVNQSSPGQAVAYLRMAFLASDSTVDSDTNGVLDLLQNNPPQGYRNRWDAKDNCQTLARWSGEEE